MFSRPKILFLVSLLFVALLNPKFNPYLPFKFLIFYHSYRRTARKGRRIKGIAMAQWVNRLWNNIFVNPPPLPLLCEISGALHLAQPGLTAGWPSVHPAGWQTKYR